MDVDGVVAHLHVLQGPLTMEYIKIWKLQVQKYHNGALDPS